MSPLSYLNLLLSHYLEVFLAILNRAHSIAKPVNTHQKSIYPLFFSSSLRKTGYAVPAVSGG